MSVEPKVFEHVRAVLNGFDDKYLNNGKLKRNKIIEDLDAYDEQLMTALLSDQLIHQTYTKKLAGVEIFEVNQFIQMLEFKEYWEDSYTKYSNKIGLTAGGKFIDESEDVVLDFPFKDTVLKAGMSKEDVENYDDANEPFLNEVIAKPEIDELLEPKVFVNTKRYDADGEHEADSFTDTDNLVIKGNNLIALYSLKKRYAGKVKSIFIDPPYFFLYTKPTDSFIYNSNFKLSGWLTFMKNRLEIARELLTEDGVLFITISDEGAHYLKVLADDIFYMQNFIADVTWESRNSISSDGLMSMNSNHVLVYAKNIKIIDKNDFRLALNIETFKHNDNDGRGPYRVEPFDAPNKRKNLSYPIVNPNTNETFYPPEGRCWRTTKENYEMLLADNRIRFGSKGKTKPQLKAYYKEVRNAGKGKTSSSIWHDVSNSISWFETNTTTSATKHQSAMFGSEVFPKPKPEELVKRALELSTDEGDLVLDFFMGSATTQATALKMDRQFIGIEQMGYTIKNVSIPRLQKVIEGEQGGISKDVNWQGGGSFVYAELMEKNGGFVRDVEKAANTTELLAVFDRMKNTADFDFRVDLDKFETELNTFESLADQKRELLRILDKNQLYYNYANIDDADVRDLIADHDYKFNQSFYRNGGED